MYLCFSYLLFIKFDGNKFSLPYRSQLSSLSYHFYFISFVIFSYFIVYSIVQYHVLVNYNLIFFYRFIATLWLYAWLPYNPLIFCTVYMPMPFLLLAVSS